MAQTNDLMEKLRAKVLRRGGSGIKGLARTFRIYDDSGDKGLVFEEFSKGLNDYGLLDITEEEKRTMFDAFDRDGSGKISFEEFLQRLRPPMSEARKKMVEKAFAKFDRTGDGVVTVEDLRGIYNAREHPKFRNGEWTEEECFRSFINTFENSGEKDGKVTKDEFFNYYSELGASIDEDGYFDLMIRQTWKI
ncbi:hypothetical protein EGW08_014843 [Elysia chlorotica]|uniref:EF-hand domain-containing protein n=1 Tax=Elysia chlorotica TaxID=188477 RepID=A0A433T734_ELYCH|nr:hypothetical protein EGW08_014843 [Elysia chlorotica]